MLLQKRKESLRIVLCGGCTCQSMNPVLYLDMGGVIGSDVIGYVLAAMVCFCSFLCAFVQMFRVGRPISVLY